MFKIGDKVVLQKYYLSPKDLGKPNIFEVVEVLDSQYKVKSSAGDIQFTTESNMRFAKLDKFELTSQLIEKQIKKNQSELDSLLLNGSPILEISRVQGKISVLIELDNQIKNL